MTLWTREWVRNYLSRWLLLCSDSFNGTCASRNAYRLHQCTSWPSLNSPEAFTPSQQHLASVAQCARPQLRKNRAKFKTSLCFFRTRNDAVGIVSAFCFFPLFPLLMFHCLCMFKSQDCQIKSNQEYSRGQQRVREEMSGAKRTFDQLFNGFTIALGFSGKFNQVALIWIEAARVDSKGKRKKNLLRGNKMIHIPETWIPRGLFDLSLQYIWKCFYRFMRTSNALKLKNKD